MRAFFIACVIALILAIGGYYALSAIQEPVAEAFSTSAVRLNSYAPRRRENRPWCRAPRW
jgi:hypothetical protein